MKDFSKLVGLLPFLRPYVKQLMLAMFGLALAAASVLAIGQGLKRVIDRGFAIGHAQELNQALLMLFALTLALGLGTFIRFATITWVSERFVADVRKKLFGHLLGLSPGFFETTRTGEVISRLTNDTQLIETVIGGAFSYALRNVVMMIGGLVMLAVTSPKLMLLVIIGVPFVVTPIVLLGRRVERLSRTAQDRVAEVSNRIDETLHEIRTVQAYVHEDEDRRQFGHRVEELFRASVARERNQAALVAIVIMLAFTAIGIILWVGGRDVLAGRLTAGELSAFVFYAVIVANGVNAVSEVYGQLKRAAGASQRLLELLATKPQIAPPAVAARLPDRPQGTLALHSVTFRYPTRLHAPALDSFSLAVMPGEVIALVGPSGAGKTTVFQLLLRFYDPDSGGITIDGVELKQLAPEEVRARIAVVSQEPVIFAANVWDNVRYGRLDASDDEVREACRAAFAEEFVARLPEGMDTWLGERGVRLSGGQRQRLAIARAILADRPILLLDEATSSLDSESERLVSEALAVLMRRRTTLIIAHRLSTVQKAQRIIVMDHGKIVAQGTHDSLVSDGGLYARLAKLQFAA